MHMPPPVPQMFCGKHVQVNCAVQAAGISRQNSGGFTHGGGWQPSPINPAKDVQSDEYV